MGEFMHTDAWLSGVLAQIYCDFLPETFEYLLFYSFAVQMGCFKDKNK